MVKAELKKLELVLIPDRGMGHVTPMVELAKRLVQCHPIISANICIFDTSSMFKSNPYIKSLDSNPLFITNRIKFLQLPELTGIPVDQSLGSRARFLISYKPIIKQVVEDQIVHSDTTGRLAGFVLDFFCTQIMDVADELQVPAYIFYASNCALLSLTLHCQHLRDHHGVDVTGFTDPDTELDVPGFKIPVPCKVLPGSLLEKGGGSDAFLDHTQKYRSARGILINTFEIESHALRTLSDDPNVPPVYPVGPVINVDARIKPFGQRNGLGRDPVIRWLDDQPPESVVFLCFGTWGIFSDDQVREIAKGLESSGHRFLWSLRLQARDHKDHGDDLSDVLPDGFLERTAERGKVIGWAPQVTVLSHPATGAFVSHCGWNSTLESLWFGVPMATWPMYAEQQMNAFRLVKELGLAVEIRMDYRSNQDRWKKSSYLIEAEVIEDGVRKVMDRGSGLREKVKEMSKLCREATEEGRSSFVGLGRFVDDVRQNSL